MSGAGLLSVLCRSLFFGMMFGVTKPQLPISNPYSRPVTDSPSTTTDGV